jgi:hypothetical protein
MITFLFWNINNKPLQRYIRELADQYTVDVLVLAECRLSEATLLNSLNAGKAADFHFTQSECPALKMFTRFSGVYLEEVAHDQRASIRRMRLPAREEVLFVAAHLPSKMYANDRDQELRCEHTGQMIYHAEEAIGHQRTLLVGDLNLNPFEKGVVMASGLHAAMTKAIARERERTVSGKQYRYFYNPMWGHFGDRTPGPPGTYYYSRGADVSYFWHMFDQVLIRPDLIERFDDETLQVLAAAGSTPLIGRNGRPTPSDHLPISFKLNL